MGTLPPPVPMFGACQDPGAARASHSPSPSGSLAALTAARHAHSRRSSRALDAPLSAGRSAAVAGRNTNETMRGSSFSACSARRAPAARSGSDGGLALDGNLWNRSFAFSLAQDSAPASGRAPAQGRAPAPLSGLTVWGLGDAQNFSGGEGGTRFDGEWRTAYLGADRRFGERWLGGVALSHGRGDADYSYAGQNPGAGRLGTDLTAVYPYVKGVLGGGTELWAMLGAGTGEATLERDRAEGDDLRGDLGLRLGVEVAGTGRFSPYLRLNARYDGGGEVSEAGYEGEAGLRYAGSRVDFELRGRWMGLAGGSNYEESGATATPRIKAAPDGTGLTATLTPSWGRPGTANFVWGQGAMPGMTPRTSADPGMMLNAELGYGIESWRLRGMLTPTIGYGRSGPAGDALRFGAGYTARSEWLRRELSIGLGLQGQQTLDGPDWGMELRTQMRW